MTDTCREMLFLAVEETITNVTFFFDNHITLMENQMPMLIIIIIIILIIIIIIIIIIIYVPYFTTV
jgi:hypothetical protein